MARKLTIEEIIEKIFTAHGDYYTYPKIEIELKNADQIGFELEIRNLTGQRVYNNYIYNQESTEQIDLSSLSEGIYTLYIFTKGKKQTIKLIINK